MSPRLRLELRRAAVPLTVVVVGLVAALIGAYSIVSRTNIAANDGERQVLRVSVTDAQGVVPGRNEVRWAGVVVGRVSDVELDGRRAVLTLEVDRDRAGGRRVHRDARLALRPQTLLQDMYVDIERSGTPRAGAATGDDVLDAQRTRTPVAMADVLNVFDEPVAERLQTLLAELSVGLDDGGAQLREGFAAFVPLLESQQRLTEIVARRERTVARLIRTSGLLFDELGRREADITSLVEAGADALGATAARAPELRRTLLELPPTLATLRSSMVGLRTASDRLRPAITALRPVTRELPEGLAAVRELAVTATPALRTARTPVRRLRPLAADLAPVARDLEGAFAGLAPQAPRLDRITAALARCERFVPKFFAWTSSVLKWGAEGTPNASARGDAVITPSVPTGTKDPALEPVIGCADGRGPR